MKQADIGLSDRTAAKVKSNGPLRRRPKAVDRRLRLDDLAHELRISRRR